MNQPGVGRDELMVLVDERKDDVRKYLRWARQNDNEKDSKRMLEREDIKAAERAAKLFPESWWGVVAFTCFGSITGAEAVARHFPQTIEPSEAFATLRRINFPPGSVGHHRRRPALKGAKEALVSACANHKLFHNVLSNGGDFDTRYRRLRDEQMRQWGRTTVFDLLLRAGTLGICDRRYKPRYAYLAGSTGPTAGFALVWGVQPKHAKDLAWAEALLRAWTENWGAVAKSVGVQWDTPPLDPSDQENFLCIYHQQRDGRRISGRSHCVRSEPGDPSSQSIC